MAIYFTKYAELIFEPKRILTKEDWLSMHREPDQRFKQYKYGYGNNIRWMSKTQNKIHLFVGDDTLTRQQVQMCKKYAAAFFYGVAGVEVITTGELVPAIDGSKN